MDKANTVLNGNKHKIQSLCKEPDLVICDHECLYVAFLEHLINFMGLFSSKCLSHTEKEACHKRSKETLMQQHLFKASSFYSPRDNPFQCKISTTPIRAVMICATSLTKLLGVMTSLAATRTPKEKKKSNEELDSSL